VSGWGRLASANRPAILAWELALTPGGEAALTPDPSPAYGRGEYSLRSSFAHVRPSGPHPGLRPPLSRKRERGASAKPFRPLQTPLSLAQRERGAGG